MDRVGERLVERERELEKEGEENAFDFVTTGCCCCC